MLFTSGIICGSGSFAVQLIWGSFPVWGSFAVGNHLRRCTDLRAPSENFVFKSVMQWIKYRKEERMDAAAQVIGAVRLGLVDIKDVIEELNTEEMQSIPEIHLLVYETLLHNCCPTSVSEFALVKAKPRSMSLVRTNVLFLPYKRHIKFFFVEVKARPRLGTYFIMHTPFVFIRGD